MVVWKIQYSHLRPLVLSQRYFRLPWGPIKHFNNVDLKDRENVDVIAHELAHSWSGNLVTNASWEHFWINEGWTTYLERRVCVPTPILCAFFYFFVTGLSVV